MKTSRIKTLHKYSPHLGGYKQKIKTLSENNKDLVEALENYRYQCSEKEKKLIQVSTATLQNSISAKAKLNKLAKDLKEFLLSIEEIISLMNINSSAYPTMFVSNMKPKKPRDCLIESILEETLSELDDYSVNKPQSLDGIYLTGKNGSTMSSSSVPTKVFTKSSKTVKQKIPLNLKQIRETSSESPLRKQDFSSDTQTTIPSKKRCRKLNKVCMHQEVLNQTTRKKQKPNPLCESEKIIQKHKQQTIDLNPEPCVDKISLDPVIYVINTNQPQDNLQDVTVKEFYTTNLLDKHHEESSLQKTQILSKKSMVDSKAGKTNRHIKKNNGVKPSKRTQYSKEVTIQETIGSGKNLQNKQILCSVENVPCDEAVKTTVTAEIHKPPSDKLAEKKAHSPNKLFKIMQPCVVLTDIRETSLLIESDFIDPFVEAPLKVQAKKYVKQKSNLTVGKKLKTRGSLPPHPISSRTARSRKIISYKENNLNKKMRRS